jgi:hypothetical protein
VLAMDLAASSVPFAQLPLADPPRWKRRALYDARRLVRLAVHDEIGGILLGAALQGRGRIAPAELRALVEQRIS